MTQENDVQAYRERRAEEIVTAAYDLDIREYLDYRRKELRVTKAGFDAGRGLGRLEGVVHALTGLGGQEEELEHMRGLLAAILAGGEK